MHLKISSPEKIIFEGEINKIILPTELGDIIIKPWQKPMVMPLKPGIITISAKGKIKEKDFVFSNESISISISKWMPFVNEDLVKIATTVATTKISQDEKQLKDKKMKLEKEIRELRKKGSLEEIENSLIKLEKVNADLKLHAINK